MSKHKTKRQLQSVPWRGTVYCSL